MSARSLSPSSLGSVRGGVFQTCAPDTQRAGNPLIPLHCLHTHNFGEQRRQIPSVPGLGVDAAPSLAWGSSDPHAGFPLPPSLNPCNTNMSWRLALSSIWQRRCLNPTLPSSALPAISSCNCIPSADTMAQESSSCLICQPCVLPPCWRGVRTLAPAMDDCQHTTGEVIAGDSHVTPLITHTPVRYRLSLNSLKTISDPSLY